MDTPEEQAPAASEPQATAPAETPTSVPASPAEDSGTKEPTEAPETPVEPKESRLLKRAKAVREDADKKASLATQLEAKIAAPTPEAPRFDPDYADADEIDRDSYLRTVASTAQMLAAEQVQREFDRRDAAHQEELYKTNIVSDANFLMSAYDELNPDKPDYDATLDDFITDEYDRLSQGGQRRDISLKDFTTRQMDQLKRVRAMTEAKYTQSDQNGAITPVASRTVPVEFDKLSTAEMEARLGFAKPPTR